MCTCVHMPAETRRGCPVSWSCRLGSCEPPGMGAENWAQVLLKSSHCSQVLSCLTSDSFKDFIVLFSLESAIFLPPPAKCRDYRCAPMLVVCSTGDQYSRQLYQLSYTLAEDPVDFLKYLLYILLYAFCQFPDLKRSILTTVLILSLVLWRFYPVPSSVMSEVLFIFHGWSCCVCSLSSRTAKLKEPFTSGFWVAGP